MKKINNFIDWCFFYNKVFYKYFTLIITRSPPKSVALDDDFSVFQVFLGLNSLEV